MKINYRKINPYFFFIGIVMTVLISVLNSSLSETEFKDYFLMFGSASLVACVLCFYRFNNGLIALIRGRFAKPKRNNLRFVDYDDVQIHNIDAFKDSVEYGRKSIIAYKLNSRKVYQIIRQDNGLLIRRCYPEDGAGIITDFSKAYKPAGEDSLIPYSLVRSITYKISPDNFYLPIISISVGKKHFRFIGYLEPFDREDINSFFSGLFRVKGQNVQKNPEEQINEIECITFRYNLTALLTCIVAPSLFVAPAAVGAGVSHLLWIVYAAISIALLILYLYLPVAKPKKYKLDLMADNKSDGKKDISVGLILLSVSMALSMFFEVTVINIKWYLILVTVVFVILITLYFKSTDFSKKNYKENKYKKLYAVICAVFVFSISAAALVSAVNYAVPLRTQTNSYAVVQMYEQKERRGNIKYYADIIVDGTEQTIQIDDETYNSRSSRITAAKSTGILGVQYIVEQ